MSTWELWVFAEIRGYMGSLAKEGVGRRPVSPETAATRGRQRLWAQTTAESGGSPAHWWPRQVLEVTTEQLGKPTCCKNYLSYNHRCKIPKLKIGNQTPKACPLDFIYLTRHDFSKVGLIIRKSLHNSPHHPIEGEKVQLYRLTPKTCDDI